MKVNTICCVYAQIWENLVPSILTKMFPANQILPLIYWMLNEILENSKLVENFLGGHA